MERRPYNVVVVVNAGGLHSLAQRMATPAKTIVSRRLVIPIHKHLMLDIFLAASFPLVLFRSRST